MEHVIIVFNRSSLYCAKKKDTNIRWFLSPGKMSSAHVRFSRPSHPCATFGNPTAIAHTCAQGGRNFAMSDELRPTSGVRWIPGGNMFSFQIPSIRDPQGTGHGLEFFSLQIIRLEIWKEKMFISNVHLTCSSLERDKQKVVAV